MLLGCLADLHLYSRDLRKRSGLLNVALQHMRRERVKAVLNMGDTFEFGRVYDGKASTAEVLSQFVQPVQAAGIPWLTIAGNHDWEDPLRPSALQLFSGHPLIRCFENLPSRIILESDRGERVLLLFLPWQNKLWQARVNPGIPWEEWSQYCCNLCSAPPSGAIPSVLMGHVETQGAWGDSYRAALPGTTQTYTVEQLRGIGADISLFGHLHARQKLWDTGHYLGAFTRLTHGEAVNPDGYGILNTETMELKFYEVGGPRYYTVSYQEAPGMVLNPGDKLRVTNTPSGGTLYAHQPEVEVTMIQTREVADVQPARAALDTSNLRSLTLDWCREVGIQVFNMDRMERAIQELESLPELSRKFELPTRLIRVSLDGVGPHVGREFVFQEGWTAVLGRTGAGKSYLLESLVAAIWSTYPTGTRTLLNSVADRGQLTVEFRTQEHEWKIERTFAAGKQVSCWVWRDRQQVAGDKVTATTAYLAEVFGPSPQHHLGTWFLTQDADEDLCKTGDTDRRAWIRSWLDLGRYDVMAEQAKARVKALGSASAMLQVVRERIQEAQEGLPELEQRLQLLDSSYAAMQGQIKNLEQQYHEEEQKIRESMELNERARLLDSKVEISHGHAVQMTNRLLELRMQELVSQQALEILEVNAGLLAERQYPLQLAYDLYHEARTLDTQNHPMMQRGEQLLQQAGCRPDYLPCPLIDAHREALRHGQEVRDRMIELESRVQFEALEVMWRQAEELDREIFQDRIKVRDFALRIQDTEREQQKHQGIWSAAAAEREALGPVDPVDTLRLNEYGKALLQARECHQKLLVDMVETKSSVRHRTDTLEQQGRRLPDLEEQVLLWEVWQLMARACGKDGIPQFLINQQLPAIQRALDDISIHDFQGDHQVRIGTTQEKKTGGFSEAFTILYRGRDIRSASGGQRSLVRLILRVALGVLRGRGSLLILDEPTVWQDHDTIEASLAMLSRLSDVFCQTIISTHDPSIAGRVPQRVEV